MTKIDEFKATIRARRSRHALIRQMRTAQSNEGES
jgi:hypothetical protein